MVFKDKIYKFEIEYIDCDAGPNEENKKSKIIYSDNNDIYALDGIPQKVTKIWGYVLESDGQTWRGAQGDYIVAEKLTKQEAREELEILSKLDVPEKFRKDKEKTIAALKSYCKKKSTEEILINRNIEYKDSISGRFPVSPHVSIRMYFQYISPKQLVNGKIYPIEKIESGEIEDDRPYLDLE